MTKLEASDMRAQKVMIDSEEYCTWLDQNSFESCYGARITYATERLGRKL